MSNADFLGRAIETVKKAIETDTAGEYEKAYQLYYSARESQTRPGTPPAYRLTSPSRALHARPQVYVSARRHARQQPRQQADQRPGEKNQKSKEMIRGKVAEYMERAEKLKQHLNQNDASNRKKPAAMGSNGKAAGGSGKGGKCALPSTLWHRIQANGIQGR